MSAISSVIPTIILYPLSSLIDLQFLLPLSSCVSSPISLLCCVSYISVNSCLLYLLNLCLLSFCHLVSPIPSFCYLLFPTSLLSRVIFYLLYPVILYLLSFCYLVSTLKNLIWTYKWLLLYVILLYNNTH